MNESRVYNIPNGARGKRSPASWKRNALRCASWLQRACDRKANIPDDKLLLIERFNKCVDRSRGSLGHFCSSFRHRSYKICGRQRDIFPLPCLVGDALKPVSYVGKSCKILQDFANRVILSLNFLYQCNPTKGLPTKTTQVQRDVQQRVLSRCDDFCTRIMKCSAGAWEHAVPDWVPDVVKPTGPKYGNLVADKVDVLASAATCDPSDAMAEEYKTIINDSRLMFPCPTPGLEKFEDISTSDRKEYILLTLKQLKCRQLGLTQHPRGGGTIIAVGKLGSMRQRAVWHGSRVSQAAVPPPHPEHLACPSALLHLKASAENPQRVSKRDARCFFDQLTLPASLRRWMARPAVLVSELMHIGQLTKDEIEHFLEELEILAQERVWPISRCWPMGFSWSSCVGQSKMLHACRVAHLDVNQILSCDSPSPTDQSLTYAVATDDFMFFSNAGPGRSSAAANAFGSAFAAMGGQKNVSKDICDQLSATCVGVELEQGVSLGVPAARCLAMLLGVLHFSDTRQGSPRQVHQQLGVMQWFDLLRRGKLAVYDKFYGFVKDVEDRKVRPIPETVLDELLLGMCLGVFWKADLTRPHAPFIAAADASMNFGFGGSVLRVPEEKVESIARVSEKRCDYIMLDDGLRHTRDLKRLGHPHYLDLRQEDFVHVFSVRKKHSAHINILEGEAFLLLLRWILRKRSQHCKRVAILCDSQVWAGAKPKGRSSTCLNRLCRKAAALEMAGDILVNLILVPSSENPSDAPSRGTRWKAKRKPPRQARVTRTEQYLDQVARAYYRLRESGMISSESPASLSESLTSQ